MYLQGVASTAGFQGVRIKKGTFIVSDRVGRNRVERHEIEWLWPSIRLTAWAPFTCGYVRSGETGRSDCLVSSRRGLHILPRTPRRTRTGVAVDRLGRVRR